MKRYFVFPYRALFFFACMVVFFLLCHNRFSAALGASLLMVGVLHLVSEAWALAAPLRELLGELRWLPRREAVEE